MEMVLPRNYVEIEQEEMMYLDGGDFSPKHFNRSMKNLALRFGSRAFSQAGGSIVALASWGYWTTVTTIGAKTALVVTQVVSVVATPIGGIVAGVIAVGGFVALVAYMGSADRF